MKSHKSTSKNPNDPEGPIKALKAFLRVHVKAGDSQEVNIELAPETFHSFNDNTQTMEIRPESIRYFTAVHPTTRLYKS